jgi:hypothetical protein
VLLSIDTEKTDMNQGAPRGNCIREDNDYALAWVRNYGRGRVFYCTIAHNPYVFWGPKMLQFYLAATQFALGDLPAPTTPSAKLTPAIRAQEKLGWQLTLVPAPSAELTLFETIDKAAELGLLYVGGCNRQKVSADIPKSFDEQLSNEDLKQIRLKLDAAGIRLLTYRMEPMPSDETEQRRMFEFARRMGAHVLIRDGEKLPTDSSLLEIVCSDEPVPRKETDVLPDKASRRGPGNPIVFTIEFTGDRAGSTDEVTKRIELFNNLAIQMANGGGS